MNSTLESIKQLCEISSYTLDPIGVNKVGQKVVKMLAELDLTWNNYPCHQQKYGDMLHGKSKDWQKDALHILLCGHLDTVHADYSSCKTDLSEDKLYAPGSVDMKGGLVVMVESLLLAAASKPLCNISVLLMPEEEMMHVNNFPQIKEIVADVDIALVFEGQGSADTPPTSFDVHSLVVKRKGGMSVNYAATASGGHSGILATPELRHSAIHELVQQANRHILSADYGKGITTNVGIFGGGKADNILAQDASAVFEVRVQEPADFDYWLDRLTNNIQLFDASVKIEPTVKSLFFPMAYTQQNKKLYHFIEQKLGGKYSISEEFRGGASDANRLLYFNPNIAAIDNLGPVGGREHTTDEFVYLDSLQPKIDFCVDLLKVLADYK